jgi:NAD(P)H dehydrogenase (quinone)
VQGFAFGLRDAKGRTRRYGDGGLAGRRALIVTSVGARASGFGPRGVHGAIEDVLFPVQHGVLWYTGMAALPPFVVYGADRMTPTRHARYAAGLRDRVRGLATDAPVPFRCEQGGDYDADLVLRADLAPGAAGLGVHRGDAG